VVVVEEEVQVMDQEDLIIQVEQAEQAEQELLLTVLYTEQVDKVKIQLMVRQEEVQILVVVVLVVVPHLALPV
jgi:hypothetical protein